MYNRNTYLYLSHSDIFIFTNIKIKESTDGFLLLSSWKVLLAQVSMCPQIYGAYINTVIHHINSVVFLPDTS